ncbi:MAG TPA: mandelate racemase/muconate lactonizing enzyme family protein [Gemmataceae bacterium]|jgi:gluconate/galactonate dehydratase|nr:mandelate racemase/muconate lactonizing enzyme family protein [Gemmataceae bacterium]
MRIVAVKTAVVEANYDYTYVRVFSDNGEYGTGECFFAPGLTGIIRDLCPVIVGKDPRHIERLTRELRRAASGAGAVAGYAHNAISGMEAALWDLIGKHFRVPVWQLLGGQFRDQIRVYADCHAGEGLESWGPALLPREPAWLRKEQTRRGIAGKSDLLSAEAYAAHAKETVARGFDFLKFDLDAIHAQPSDILIRPLSTREIQQMTEVVRAVRQAVGLELQIALDCHWRYSLGDALKIARALAPFDIAWLEDPLPPESVDGFRILRESTSVPVCTGENLYLREGFKPLLEQYAVNIISPDIQKTSGLWEAKRIADLAALYEIPVAPHNISSPLGTIASCHVCSTLANFMVLEFHGADVPFWEDLLTGVPKPLIQNGRIHVPDGPGLGVELNESVAREYAKPGEGFFEG